MDSECRTKQNPGIVGPTLPPKPPAESDTDGSSKQLPKLSFCQADGLELMSTNVMGSLRFTEFGPPSVLPFEEVAIPEPGEGEVLIVIPWRDFAAMF